MNQKLKPLSREFIQEFITACIRKAWPSAIISTEKDSKFKSARIIAQSGDEAEKILSEIDIHILRDLNDFIRQKTGENPKEFDRRAISIESIVKGKTLEIKY